MGPQIGRRVRDQICGIGGLPWVRHLHGFDKAEPGGSGGSVIVPVLQTTSPAACGVGPVVGRGSAWGAPFARHRQGHGPGAGPVPSVWMGPVRHGIGASRDRRFTGRGFFIGRVIQPVDPGAGQGYLIRMKSSSSRSCESGVGQCTRSRPGGLDGWMVVPVRWSGSGRMGLRPAGPV